uniref:Uncharacterized protein n=1 Tax=Eutreptiella gymnastica TaxID=73025 RepID=A0A6U7YZM2_9EUGL
MPNFRGNLPSLYPHCAPVARAKPEVAPPTAPGAGKGEALAWNGLFRCDVGSKEHTERGVWRTQPPHTPPTCPMHACPTGTHFCTTYLDCTCPTHTWVYNL